MQETQQTRIWSWSGRSPGGGNGTLLQYSCLGNPMDREAWQARYIGLQRVGHDWNNSACTPFSKTSWWLKRADRNIYIAPVNPYLSTTGWFRLKRANQQVTWCFQDPLGEIAKMKRMESYSSYVSILLVENIFPIKQMPTCCLLKLCSLLTAPPAPPTFNISLDKV